MRRARDRKKDEAGDQKAVRRVLAGDRRAFAPLLVRYQASALGMCRRILGSSDVAAEDVVQEAALQAFLNLHSLREPRLFSAWLHSIAANLAYSALRVRRPISVDPLAEGASLEDTAPRPEEVQAARELHDTVLAALRGLSDVNREAVIGYYLAGQSYAELAELLDVPESTIKGRLYKGRRQLEPTLAPVAREMFGKERKEDRMAIQDKVEVAVDEVIRIAGPDQGWSEFPEVARRMTAPEPGETPPAPAAVLIMRETAGERVMPIYVGLNEAFSIWLTITGAKSLRPITHDLMRQIMDATDLRVERTTVSRLSEDTFYAEISLRQHEKTYEADARPSDAIALAVRMNAPIYVAHEVFEEAALASKQAWPEWHREEFGKDAPDASPES